MASKNLELNRTTMDSKIPLSINFYAQAPAVWENSTGACEKLFYECSRSKSVTHADLGVTPRI